jgi:acetolactate synthase-1/2/3 large subunit
MMKLSDYVMDFIAAQGVEQVFTLAGGGAMHLIDSLGKSKSLTYVCCLHEQACAIAAEAYAQYTNKLGVAVVTSGPGGTNTLTGVAGAWLDSTSLLIVSGQVKKADLASTRGVRQMGFQEIDIVNMVKPITKYAVLVTDPLSIRYHLEKAVYLAQHGRPGPVWIDIPLDVQAIEIDEKQLAAFDPAELVPAPTSIPQKTIQTLINQLNQAERPIILAGNGIRLAGALDDFLNLIELLHIPVLTTWKAIDFLSENHPLYAGRPGAIGQRGANFAQQNSDLLISIGARLDFGQTAFMHRLFAPHAIKAIVDIDPNEITKLDMAIEFPIVANASAFIHDMSAASSHVVKKDRAVWLARCKDWSAKYPVVLKEYWDEKEYVNDYVLIDVLSDEMSPKDLFVPGSSGACSERSMQAFRVKEGMRIFNTEGLGSMGFGIPAAIGGCLASNKMNTVCIEGDGGFVMNIQELETVRRLGLPIKFFVLNNAGYGSIRATQKNYFEGRLTGSSTDSGLSLPDFKAVGAAFGIAIRQIRNHDTIREQVREVLKHDGPILCEVMVNPEQLTAPRVTSQKMPDGSMVSMPMEDMWPFLDREEFRANMFLPAQAKDAAQLKS